MQFDLVIGNKWAYLGATCRNLQASIHLTLKEIIMGDGMGGMGGMGGGDMGGGMGGGM